VFDPRGGQWNNGRYVPSLVAAIGEVLERHMRETGFLAAVDIGVSAPEPDGSNEPKRTRQLGPLCPKCSQPGLVKEAGCLSCMHCGWSKCS
ncbi:MAG TPA: ribonucleoside-diphosphate reductase, adenosylcobalamin-dependent, partial [Acetobacteraceae bacterium]|nr:ribonucleoside-diphosphate reductase, adenosylcobalamin-dependent [Acetobacteraceae bacterium]